MHKGSNSGPLLVSAATWGKMSNSSRSQFPHLQNGHQFLLMTSKDYGEVCLLMMLRMLGTYKYFPRRAGIFPLAIRLEEVCSNSSVHL